MKEEGNEADKYATPPSTLIEVCEKQSSLYPISVALIPVLYVNYTTIPIEISISHSPATDLTIRPYFKDNTGESLDIYPNSLQFVAFTESLFFQITAHSDYDVDSPQPVLKFEVGGVDSFAYSSIPDRTLGVEELSSSTIPGTVAFSVISTSSHSASVQVVVSHIGLVYWWLGCGGSPGLSYDSLKANISDIIDPLDNLSLFGKLREEYATTEVDPGSQDDTIYSYFWRLFAEHCSATWASSNVFYTNTAGNLEFDWLYAGTNYTLGGYLDNMQNSTAPKQSLVSFQTSSLPPIYTLSVSIASEIPESQEEIIRTITADKLGVNPLWLADGQIESSGGSTTITWNVLLSRKYVDYSPANIVTQSSMLSLAKESLVRAGYVSSISLISYTSTAFQSNGNIRWIQEPYLNQSEVNSHLFKFTAEKNGLVCVLWETEKQNNLNAEQVLVGLTSQNALTNNTECVEVLGEIEGNIAFRDLAGGSEYQLHFILCNDYPLWPTCSEITTTALETVETSSYGETLLILLTVLITI